MKARFRISRVASERVVAHAWEAKPLECCGVLLGASGEIVDAIRTRNLADEPTRFLMDPQDHFEARRAARQRGLDVVGFYHSHPHSPAIPSPRDVAEATYRECVYLIASVASEPADVRLFQLDADGFVEVELVQSS